MEVASVVDSWKIVCALCGAHEAVCIDIFGDEAKSRKLTLKMETCLPLKINSNNSTLKRICYQCLFNIENYYNFYNNVIESTTKLKAQLGNNNMSIQLLKVSSLINTDETSKKNEEKSNSVNLIDKCVSTDELECNVCKTIFSIYIPRFNNSHSKLVDYDTDSKSSWDGDFNDILGEISARKVNKKRTFDSIFNSIPLKRQKFYETTKSNSTSRRKNKQPKKISVLPTTNCLLCDSQFQTYELFVKHLHDCHELEPSDIYTNNAKLRITDVLQHRLKSNRNELSSPPSPIDFDENQDNQFSFPIIEIPSNVNIDIHGFIAELWREKQYFPENINQQTINSNYLCQLCLRDFNDKSSLWLHLRATHPKHAALTCGICLQLNDSWELLQNHLQSIHNPNRMTVAEMRKYFCVICWRQNDIKKKLINHMYVHEFIIQGYKNSGIDFNPEHFIRINSVGSSVNDIETTDLDSKLDKQQNIFNFNKNVHEIRPKDRMVTPFTMDDNMEQDIEEISINEDEEIQSVLSQTKVPNNRTEEFDLEVSNIQKPSRNYTLTYGCEWCSRTLSSKWERWLHVATIHAPQNELLQCTFPHCHKVFVTEVFRNEHEQHHQIQGPTPNSCEICCKLWNTRVDFYKHMMGVHPQAVPLVCGVCLKIFPTVPNLYSHVQSSHLPLQGDFVCNVCGRSYSNKSKMLRHRRIHGVNELGVFMPEFVQTNPTRKIKSLNQDSRASPSIIDKSQNDILSPNFYNKNFANTLQGLSSSTNKSNQSLGDDADSDSENEHLNTKLEIDNSNTIDNLSSPIIKSENLICKECPDVSFSSYDDFSAHKRNIHQIFYCDLCSKSYGRNSHLWKHVNRCHKGNKLITCQICFKTSASKYHLQQHFNKIHALKTERPNHNSSPQSIESFLDKKFDGYSFESVKQSFLRQELLEKEQMKYYQQNINNDENELETKQPPKEIDVNSELYTSIITNYNPPANAGAYKCLKCNKGFTKRYLLKKHKKNCRPRMQKDLLTRCKSCERIFKDRQSLQKHLANYHSEFKCHLCDVTFPSKCEIISHIRFTHPNHPDFVCECGQILRSTNDLNSHKADHRNSHICQFCGDSLLTIMQLKMHVLSLHRKILSLSCGICLKLFATQHILRDHVKLVHFKDTKFGNSCPVCGKKYGSKWKCFDHINKSHGKIFKPCKICLSVFENEDELRQHFCNFHLGCGSSAQFLLPPPKIKPSSTPIKTEYASDENLEDIDDSQNDLFEDEEELPTQVPLPTTLTSLPLSMNLPSIPKITITSNKDNYSIVQKNSSSAIKSTKSTSSTPTQSKRTVYDNSDTPSICEICLKTWPAKKHLWQHYIRCHKTVAATICGICLKTHNSYLELRNHLNSKHANQLYGRGFSSNFICKICGRYHNARSKLRLHMVIHVNYDLSDEIIDYSEIKKENKLNDDNSPSKINKPVSSNTMQSNSGSDVEMGSPFIGYNIQQRKSSENYLRNYLSLLDCFQIMKTLPPQNINESDSVDDSDNEELKSLTQSDVDCDSEDERRKLLLKMSPISIKSYDGTHSIEPEYESDVNKHKNKNDNGSEVSDTNLNIEHSSSEESEDSCNNEDCDDNEQKVEVKNEIREDENEHSQESIVTKSESEYIEDSNKASFEVDPTNNCLVLKYEDGRVLRYENLEYEIIQDEEDEENVAYEVYDDRTNTGASDDVEEVNEIYDNQIPGQFQIDSAIKSINNSNGSSDQSQPNNSEQVFVDNNSENDQVILIREEVVSEDIPMRF